MWQGDRLEGCGKETDWGGGGMERDWGGGFKGRDWGGVSMEGRGR